MDSFTNPYDYRHPGIQGDIELPDYYPLNQNLVVDFEGTARFQSKVDQTIKESINDIVTQTDEYLKFLLDNENLTHMEIDTEFLNTNLSALVELLRSQHNLSTWKTSVAESKVRIRLKQRGERSLNMETYEYYQNEAENGIHFGDLIRKEYEEYKDIHDQEASFETILRTNDAYKYLKNVAFILKNPQDPLPDDTADDDLEVAGGKISLKDPISLNYFQTPLISKKCGHIFEKDIISDYLSNNRKCPVDGCDAVLLSNDLKPDNIMSLRVKAYFLQAKNRKPQKDVERL